MSLKKLQPMVVSIGAVVMPAGVIFTEFSVCEAQGRRDGL